MASSLAGVLGAAAGCPEAVVERPGDDDDQPAEEDPVETDARFLIRDGVGSSVETVRYYGSLGVPLEGLDLQQWRDTFIGASPIEAFYRNTSDLGFWREMSCSESLDRGVGGCAVRNWAGPDDKDNGAANLGTVAMRLDDEGRVQFYAFGPDGALSTFVVLDDEGEKFVPMACTICHGGEARIGDAGGLGSVFREFEPSLFELRTDADPAVLNEQFFRLNRIVALANERVKREVEGAPFGADRSGQQIVSYLEQMYSSGGTVARDVHDRVHVPESWRAPEDAEEDDARDDLWTQVVNPYCMGCHRSSSSYDFSDYQLFSPLREVKDGVAEIRRLMDFDAGGIVMPQSQLLYRNLAADITAQGAIDQWVGIAENHAPVVVVGPPEARATAGESASFDAAASFDEDGDALSFLWSQTAGPTAVLSDAESATVLLEAPDAPGARVTLAVRVQDGRGGTATATVVLAIDDGAPNQVPEAVIDAPLEAVAGTILTASAAASGDADGDALSFAWATIGAAVFPRTDATAIAVLVPPARSGLDLVLGVSDGRGGSDEVSTHVDITAATGTVLVDDPGLAIPDASAAGVAASLALDAAPAATILAMRVPLLLQHSFVGDLRVILRGPGGFESILHNREGGGGDDIARVFEVPAAIGRAAAGTWQLLAIDDTGSDTGVLVSWGLDVELSETAANQPPTAIAGASQSVQVGSVVVLDGTQSFDPDGDALSFSWAQSLGPTTFIDVVDGVGARAEITPASAGLHRFTLTVADSEGALATAFVDVTVTDAPPTGQLKLVEVLVNPSGLDDGLEWIRLRNDTNAAVDLARFAVAFGGNTTWGNTASGNGGVLALHDVLAPGACKLISAGLSSASNGSPALAGAVIVVFPGNGLQNPNVVPDAIGLFDVTGGPVAATSIPVDVVVYGKVGAVSPSAFVGPAGAAAAIDIVVANDAVAQSFRRSASGWSASAVIGQANGPTPNGCE